MYQSRFESKEYCQRSSFHDDTKDITTTHVAIILLEPQNLHTHKLIEF